MSIELTRFYPLFVTPVYYGMLMFNIAKFGAKPNIYSVPTSDKLIKVWVCINPDAGNSYSVVVINKHDVSSSRSPVTITIKTPSTSRFAKSMIMSNPSGLSGLVGTTIGGIDFNNQNGEYQFSSISINSFTVSITVSPATAMLVRISDSEQGLLFSDDSRATKNTGGPGNEGFLTPELNEPIIKGSSGEKVGPILLSVVLAVVIGLLI